MPTDKQSAFSSDIASLLAPVREAQAALVRAHGLGMGAAMEQAFAGLVDQLAAEPKAASFQPLGGGKAGAKPAQQGGAASPAGAAEQRLSSADEGQGELAGLTQDLMARAFAQAIGDATHQRREAGQAQRVAKKTSQTANAPEGSAGGFGVFGQLNLGKVLKGAVDQAIEVQSGGASKAHAGSSTQTAEAPAPTKSPALMQRLGRAMASAGEQVARVATAPASVLPGDVQGQANVPTTGAWQALCSIDALLKDLDKLDAKAAQTPTARKPGAEDGTTASRAGSGAGANTRFPMGFDVQTGGQTAETAKATEPGLLRASQGSARGASNFDSVLGNSGTGGLAGELASLVSSVWPPLQDALQRAGAARPGRSGGLVVPQRTGSGAQGGAAGAASTDSVPRSMAPRSGSMLAPAGQRAAASSALQEAAAGKVLAAVRVGESANDALNPAAPGVAPAASGNGASALSDDALAEQLNRVLIEQAWRGGVDLS